jgi:hypothetical protein
MALFYYKIDGYIRADNEQKSKDYLNDLTNDKRYPEEWKPIKLKEIEIKEVDEEIAQP